MFGILKTCVSGNILAGVKTKSTSNTNKMLLRGFLLLVFFSKYTVSNKLPKEGSQHKNTPCLRFCSKILSIVK